MHQVKKKQQKKVIRRHGRTDWSQRLKFTSRKCCRSASAERNQLMRRDRFHSSDKHGDLITGWSWRQVLPLRLRETAVRGPRRGRRDPEQQLAEGGQLIGRKRRRERRFSIRAADGKRTEQKQPRTTKRRRSAPPPSSASRLQRR